MFTDENCGSHRKQTPRESEQEERWQSRRKLVKIRYASIGICASEIANKNRKRLEPIDLENVSYSLTT